MKTFRSGSTLNTFRSTEHEKTDRQKERTLRSWRRRMGFILLVIMAISALGLALLSQFSGSFSSVSSNTVTLSATESVKYKDIVNSYMTHNPFERFSFARREANLNAYVSDKLPEVKSVQISQSGMLLGKVKVIFREPVAMWVANGKTSYVDDEGIVFTKNYFAEPSVSINDNSGAAVDGSAVISSRFLSFVGQVISSVAEQGGGSVEKVVIPSAAIRYVEIYLVDRSYPFRAQIDRNGTAQATDIVQMIKHLDSKGIKPSYVDARVAGKAYWK